MSIVNKLFKQKNNMNLIAMLTFSVFITSVLASNPSLSKYVWAKTYNIEMSSAATFGGEYITLTTVPPTYNENTLPPGNSVEAYVGETFSVIDPETGLIFYVVVKNGGTITRNEDGTLTPSNQSALLLINENRYDWYEDTQAWREFCKDLPIAQGDILVWHFGDQARTFIWSFQKFDNKKDDQPPYGKWVEIS